MIGIIFQFFSDIIEVRVDGANVLFRTNNTGSMFAPIDALKLSKDGCIKEFPDLKDREDWKEESIKRFKEKIKKMNNDDERARYIIEDLSKFQYKPLIIQKQGFRPKKL